MKKLFIIAILSVFTLNINAQDTSALDSVIQARFDSEKRVLIKEATQLTDEEAKVFWPLYEEYNSKMKEKNQEMINLINDNADRIDSLTDKEAKDIWYDKIDYDYDLVKLEKKYFKKMLRVLPAGKVVRYFQTENKIKSLMDAQMAVDVPLVNSSEE